MRPGELPPFLDAHRSRIRARLARAQERPGDIEPAFKDAARVFREFGISVWLAITTLEHAEWLVAEDRAEDAEHLLAQARETFERLKARPWLSRVATVQAEAPAEISA